MAEKIKELQGNAYFSLLGQPLHETPSLRTSPWKVFGILSVVTKSELPQLSNPTSDNVVYGTFDARTASDLVYQLANVFAELMNNGYE